MFVVLQRLEETCQRHNEEVARLQTKNSRLNQHLVEKTEKCKRLETEISELKQRGKCPSGALWLNYQFMSG
jgi:predicted nuclease with TOPRIM domain